VVTDELEIVDIPGYAALTALPAPNEPAPPEWHAHEGIVDPHVLQAPDLDDFLASTDPDYEWIVPGLLEARDRVILTGIEGHGKSTLLRQFGVQVASGIHPFTLEPIEPKRVLLLDCENSARQLRRHLGPLRERAAAAYQAGHLRIRVAPNGIDLLLEKHCQHLAELVRANRPEVLIIGPIYKLASGDPVKEEPARAVATILDFLRSEHDLALLIEAHSPYGANGSARPQRPYGASLWSRWPEFGIYLAPDGKIGHWRGDREERAWPDKLARGGDENWPWIAAPDVGEGQWDGPTNCIGAICDLLAGISPEWLSTSGISRALRERGERYRNQTIGDGARIAAERGDLEQRPGRRGSIEYRTPVAGETVTDPMDYGEPF
jgi:hypothetical protein